MVMKRNLISRERDLLLQEIDQLKTELFEAKFYNLITDHISEILAASGNIDRVAVLIKTYLNLHTCYINYDIDATSVTANVAGLATDFGQWFIDLVKTIKDIPFNFMEEKQPNALYPEDSCSLNAASFLKSIDNMLVIPPEHYCPLIPTNDLSVERIRPEDVQDFLITWLGELLIVPLKKYRGALILIKKVNETFNNVEKNLFKTIGNHIAITLDNIYHKYYDELGLKNIIFFKERLKIHEEQRKPYAVLFIKLTGVQKINDEYSYAEGNDFIIANVNKIQWILEELHFKETDKLIARTNGTILMIVLPGVKEQEELQELAELINKKLSDPYSLVDKKYMELGTSARIGGCLSKESEDYESLLIKVNDALYASKQDRYRSVKLYSKELEEEKEKHRHIMNIFKAMENDGISDRGDRFFLYYQPKVDLRDNSIIGFEALIRLITERYGIIGPNLFIDLAERENYIWLIDRFVLKEACKQIKSWARRGSEIPVSINISRYSIRSQECILDFQKIFKELDFFPYRHLLHVEVTESGLLDVNCLHILKELHKKFNLKLSIDDLGKCDANLDTLLHLYVNELIDDIKIDKLYIDKILAYDKKGNLLKDRNNDLQLDETGCNYMLAMLNMFNGLFETSSAKKPKIICEGIEHKMQANWLKEHNFVYAQGHFLGQPASAADYEHLLQSQFKDNGPLSTIASGQ